MGAVACGGCFSGLSKKSEEAKPKTYGPWVPQAKPDNLGKLALQVRIQSRQSDEESLQISNDACNLSPKDLDEQGRNALFYAVRGVRDDDGNWDRPGGSLSGVIHKTYSDNCTAHGAAEYLVRKMGLEVDFQTYDGGMTPLMEAARHGNIQTCLALLKLGADWKLQNKWGHTALDVAKAPLPEYFSLRESCFSQNKWNKLQGRITQDRQVTAHLLEEVEAKGSAEVVLADMRASLEKFLALVEAQEALRQQQAAEGNEAAAPPQPESQAPPFVSSTDGFTKNPDGTYTLEAPPNAESFVRNSANKIRAEDAKAEDQRVKAARAAAPSVPAAAAPAAPEEGAPEPPTEERPPPEAVQAAHAEMEIID
mmetsp:Transcript_127334/g.220720  ORF Transcript_127334/g.220720 Transcript_127334/m.220720 type:complete len:366 (-) Transcript_127334:169-1266(-)